MYLTLTNMGAEPEAIMSPDGSYTSVLQPHTPAQVRDEAGDVLVIGDKPDLRETFAQAAQVLASIARQLLELIAGRKRQSEQRTGKPEEVSISIANHGGQPLRVILGDGVTDITVNPGTTQLCTAAGYLEVRELGNVQVPPGQVEAP